jgi:hypothetical protein
MLCELKWFIHTACSNVALDRYLYGMIADMACHIDGHAFHTRPEASGAQERFLGIGKHYVYLF